jgi:6-phosphogluconolactonase
MRLEVVEDPAAPVADALVAAAERGGHLVLTGGSTPKRAYELAAARDADWSRATVWFTDERCVPRDHADSNFGMADAALLSRLDPAPRVLRMEGERGHEEGAAAYHELIYGELGPEPAWDLLLLGLGPDAHVASLFPGRPELGVRDRMAVGVPEAGLEPFVPRISMTLPCLNGAERAVFLVTGDSKKEAVRRAFGHPPDLSASAAHVRPSAGELTVLVDPAAAP